MPLCARSVSFPTRSGCGWCGFQITDIALLAVGKDHKQRAPPMRAPPPPPPPVSAADVKICGSIS